MFDFTCLCVCPSVHGAMKGHSTRLLGRISSGLRALVQPEVEASRENKGCKGVADGALNSSEGIKERECECNEPNKQCCIHRKQAVSDAGTDGKWCGSLCIVQALDSGA